MKKNTIWRLADNYLHHMSNKFLQKQWRSNCQKNSINPDEPAEGEEEYRSFWAQLDPNVEPYSYRLFSHYMGVTPYVIPEYIGISMIERYLNPRRYRDFYFDKNVFCQIYGKDNVAETIIARINGSCLLNGDLNPISSLGKNIKSITSRELALYIGSQHLKSVILKPSVDSSSGVGVMLFKINQDQFVDSGGNVLDGAFLEAYGNDFVIQKVLNQHPYINQFCSTSVNTLRISAYRSVKDEEIVVSGALMRIGATGSFVDNAHAGGRFVGININDGSIQKTTLDQYGTKINTWNGIDFSKSDFTIPNWDRIIDFARNIASRNKQMRLLALDICLCDDGSPKLVEVNVGGFSYWLYMYCGQDIFDGRLQEVIDYCKKSHSMHSVHFKLIDR